jgi:hypothetical protein
MSLLTQASLVLTPNAYKANKMYSIIPLSGSGDMTTTRATTATRTNNSGVIENVANGVPRLDYSNSLTSPAWLLEPQRTNRVLNSATVVTQTITTTAVANTLSFYGTGTITLSGTFSGSLVGTGASNRVSLTFTPTAGNLVLTVSGSCTNGQLEIGSYATSYIPTVASIVTRNADLMTLNNIYTNNLITSAGGTWFAEFNNNFSLIRDAASYFGLQTSSTLQTDGIVIKTAGGGFRLQISKRITNVETPLYITTTNQIKVAIKWNGTIIDIFVNGIKVTLIGSNSFTPTLMEYLNLTGSDVPKYIKSTILFPTPLTDAECVSLTTL